MKNQRADTSCRKLACVTPSEGRMFQKQAAKEVALDRKLAAYDAQIRVLGRRRFDRTRDELDVGCGTTIYAEMPSEILTLSEAFEVNYSLL
jgi:hypothetical protein